MPRAPSQSAKLVYGRRDEGQRCGPCSGAAPRRLNIKDRGEKHSGQEPIFQTARKERKNPNGSERDEKGEQRREGTVKCMQMRMVGGGVGGTQGNTHIFNKELCQSVLLLDTFFQFTQENTIKGWREEKEGTFFRTVSFLSGEMNDTRLSPNPTPKVRHSGRTGESWVPRPPDRQGNVALTPYANHKSGEYFQTRFYPFLACPQGHPFLLFSS